MTAGKPRIAIPEIEQNLTVENYTRAVFEAGMEPVVISFQADQLSGYQKEYVDYGQFHAENYDGLLLPGGRDINPARYGETNTGSLGVHDTLDDLQLRLLGDFTREEKPVLGICRGMQLINVFFGGSLIQDLETAFRHARRREEPDRVHDSFAAEGSWIEEIYGGYFFHNSAHHQGVKRLGDGLIVDSRSAGDGVPEALHHSGLPIYGLQWHPERMCLSLEREDTVDGLAVFQYFCRLCGGDPAVRAKEAAAEIMGDMMGL